MDAYEGRTVGRTAYPPAGRPGPAYPHGIGDRLRRGPGPAGLLVDPAGDTYEELEGCLSLPEQHHPCVRWSRAAVTGFDLDGAPVEVRGDGLLARCVQHEVDHLDGVVYIDRISRRERRRALDEYAVYQARTPGLGGGQG